MPRVVSNYVKFTSSQPNSKSSRLSTRQGIWSIPWSWKVRTSVFVPAKLLRSNCSCRPSIGRILHPMIHNPILRPVRTFHKTCMTNPIGFSLRILIKDTASVVLFPRTGIHWIVSDKFELAEAIVGIIRSSGTINDELLACDRIVELLRPFVGRKSNIHGAVIRRFLPRVGRCGYYLALRKAGADCVWVIHYYPLA